MSAGARAERVAWVESPLQLINAIEYGEASGGDLVIEPRDGILQLPETIAAVSSLLPTGVRIAEPIGSIGAGGFRSAAEKVVGDVFSGQFRALVARYGIRGITIVDDGSATVHFATELLRGRLVRMAQNENIVMRTLGSLVARRLLASASTGGVTLFTAYSDDPSVLSLAALGVRVEPNEYAWLRSLETSTLMAMGAAPRHPLVILGSALVTDSQVSIDHYLDWVRSVAVAGNVSYLPHRRESDALRIAVSEIAGVTVEPGVLPVELVLGASHSLERVVTLPTSAVATLRAILEPAVDIAVTPVPESWWLPGSDPSIRRAFDQMAGPILPRTALPSAPLSESTDREDDTNVT